MSVELQILSDLTSEIVMKIKIIFNILRKIDLQRQSNTE